MHILYRLFLLMLLILGLRVLFRWVARYFSTRRDHDELRQDQGKKAVNRGPLVRDPVCGASLDPQLALPLKDGRQTHFFCSEECRQKFREEQRDS